VVWGADVYAGGCLVVAWLSRHTIIDDPDRSFGTRTVPYGPEGGYRFSEITFLIYFLFLFFLVREMMSTTGL